MKKVYSSKILDQIPKKLLEDLLFVIDFLEKNYNAYCFLVGGVVRDLILKREIFDIDLECFNLSVEKFEEAMKSLGAKGVGKSFFVYKYKNLDISLPRVENKVGYGHRGFEVKLALTPKEASRRRDFTINSLMFDTKTYEIIDFWGGLEDLKRKTLKATDFEKFAEDSLRVLRGVQFSARFGFKLEKNTACLCEKIALDDLPKERIFGELKKFFLAKDLHYGFYSLLQTKSDKKILGFEISKRDFFTISKALIKYQKNFLPALKEFYFLGVLRSFLEFDLKDILDKIGAPKIYYKRLLLDYSKRKDLEYLSFLTKKEPLKNSVLSFDDEVISLAKKVDIWEKPFDIGVSSKELIDQGFRGKELGLELERRRLKKVQELKKNFKI